MIVEYVVSYTIIILALILIGMNIWVFRKRGKNK
jgi:cbb3-type cytochrome oxidase subunit 3